MCTRSDRHAWRTDRLRLLILSALLVLSAAAHGMPARSAGRTGAPAAEDDLDPKRAIKSKEVAERLDAVAALAAGEHPKADRLLIGALKDKDWEVVEEAARALGGVEGKGVDDALVKLALRAPADRQRRAAAEALARRDSEDAVEALIKKLGGRDTEHALQALARVGSSGTAHSHRLIVRTLDDDDAALAGEAAEAFLALAGTEPGERLERLTRLLAHERTIVRARAADHAADRPSPGDAPALVAALESEAQDVVARRLERALAAAPEEGRVALLAGLEDAAPGAALARVRGLAATVAGVAAPDPALRDALIGAAGHADARVRAAAVHALGLDAEHEACREALLTAVAGDGDARVRRIAVAALARLADLAPAARALAARLAGDPDRGVREAAAVALARRDLAGATDALTEAGADEDWRVACVALVSLGKTRDPGARRALEQAASGAEDWRLRGAATAGLIHLQAKEAVPTLIGRLEDEASEVRRTAHLYLIALAREDLGDTPAPWREWWDANGQRIRLFDPKADEENRRKYGYSAKAQEIYRGLDLVVFQSRGDHIERVLDGFEIPHRRTAGAQVAEAGLSPGAVFFSNCTGECEPADLERMEWFVRTGGYFFGTCWALSENVQRIAPGFIKKHETGGEVLDRVPAAAVDAGSPYLEGVLAAGTTPIYALLGAHLIEVLDRERVEVLLDSPLCAERWGSGNLAAWFPVGHGVVFDSVNHFDEQGLAGAVDLREAEERQAYAVDHLGYTYAELRETRKERFWGSATQAARRVQDLSAFRLVTNFVRLRRIAGN